MIMNEVVKRLYFFILENKENIPCYNFLSKREIDVITLKMAGYKNSDIGSKLNIQEKTVKFHYHRICTYYTFKAIRKAWFTIFTTKSCFCSFVLSKLVEKMGCV